MSQEFKKEEKVQHHKQENPSLVGATFIKYFFITVITLVILFFMARYILPIFNQNGEEQQVNNGESGGILQIEIKEEDGGKEGENNTGSDDNGEGEE
jgi:flagellar biosynthesis/type III secretory pathway M-ring protein FliF/YscJ